MIEECILAGHYFLASLLHDDAQNENHFVRVWSASHIFRLQSKRLLINIIRTKSFDFYYFYYLSGLSWTAFNFIVTTLGGLFFQDSFGIQNQELGDIWWSLVKGVSQSF